MEVGILEVQGDLWLRGEFKATLGWRPGLKQTNKQAKAKTKQNPVTHQQINLLLAPMLHLKY